MGSSTMLSATAMQLSEAASREGSPERDSLKALLAALPRADRDHVRLDLGAAGSVPLPGLMADLLTQVCTVLGRGDGIVVSEVARELTTSEAARVLGVSRPTLISLLDKGEIRSRKVGTHRRVTLGEVLAYRRRQVQLQRRAYEELMAEQDDLGIHE